MKFFVFTGMKIIVELRGKPMECMSVHHAECPCMFSYKHTQQRRRYYEIMERWKSVVEKVANMDEFHKRDVHINANITFP